MTSYASPSNQIMVGEHRDDSLSSTDAGAGDGHKGTSGFWPSQPCGSLNPSLALPSPTSATKGNATSSALGYTQFNSAFLATAYASAQAAGPIGSKAYVSYFKAYDAMRVAWDRHSSMGGANYSFADGHAKYQNLGQVTNPNAYEFGDRWYPTPAAWNTSPCQ
jgi:prepilin-type processing-associated H-X9-DG protein